jgi:hypothetical protein
MQSFNRAIPFEMKLLQLEWNQQVPLTELSQTPFERGKKRKERRKGEGKRERKGDERGGMGGR